MDASFGPLAASEWWLRVLSARSGSLHIDEPLGRLMVGPRLVAIAHDDRSTSIQFRAMLEKHRGVLERAFRPCRRTGGRIRAAYERPPRRAAPARRASCGARSTSGAGGSSSGLSEHHGHGALDWGDLKRADPISRNWGYDRGTPIDRHYIEEFLASCSSDIAGSVLEVQERDFTQRFGGSRVTRSEIVDLDDGNPRATIVTDLRDAAGVDGEQFDCVILTQTVHVIDDMRAVLTECHRLLKPGAVLLATLPCASRVCLEYGDDGDLWRLTAAGARALFEPIFGPSNVMTTSYGSVLTNLAFQHGLACEELTADDFEARDPYHPLLVGVRARKSSPADRRVPARDSLAAVLLYHRVADGQDIHDLAVPAATFADQLTWLAANCCVMPLEGLLNAPHHDLPERAVAITFDDGYLDTLQSAAPILERAGLAATVFATTRWLDEPGEYWWDVLERALLLNDTPAVLAVDAGDGPLSYSCRTPDERHAAHDALHRRLVHAPLETRDRLMAQIVSWAGLVPDPHRRPIVADELQQLARIPGISIGAHSVNHLALPDQSAAVQEHEMEASARGPGARGGALRAFVRVPIWSRRSSKRRGQPATLPLVDGLRSDADACLVRHRSGATV